MSYNLSDPSNLYDPPQDLSPITKSPMSSYPDPESTFNSGSTNRFSKETAIPNMDPRYYSLAPAPRDPGVGGRADIGVEEKRRWQERARDHGWRGVLKNYINTKNQIAYMTLLILQSVIILTMIIIVFAKIEANVIKQDPSLRSITTYLTIFIFACVFVIIAGLDALRLKNVIQLIFLIFFNLALTAYSALIPNEISNALSPSNSTDIATCETNPNTSPDPNLTCFGLTGLYDDVKGFLIVIPIVGGVSSAIMIWLGWKLYEEFGWDIYKKIGADIQLKRMYFQYQVYVCLLKFDFFFFVGFSLQYLILVLSDLGGAEYGITIAALPITIAILIAAAIVVRLEIRWLNYLIFLFEAAGLAYFIYKLYRLWEPSQAYKYYNSRKTLTVFSVVAICMLVLTVAASFLCFGNFGKGLKEQIPPYFPRLRTRKADKDEEEEERRNFQRTATRMSLD